MPSTLGFGRLTAAEDEVRTTLLMDFCSAAASSIARVAAITPSTTLSVSVLRDRSEAWYKAILVNASRNYELDFCA